MLRAKPRDHVEVELVLQLEPYIYGRVVDSSGSPVARAEVRLGPIAKIVGHTTTDKEGNFEIAAKPNIIIAIGVMAGLEVGRKFIPSIEEGQDAYGVVVELEPGRTVSGELVSVDGDPVPNTDIRWRDRSSGLGAAFTSDNEGRFVIEGLPYLTVELFSGNAYQPTYIKSDQVEGTVIHAPPLPAWLKRK
jgi:hypothetical protein